MRSCAYILNGGMLDGFPLHTDKQRGEGDGNIGQHKQRKEGKIHQLFQRLCGNALPLGQDGQKTIKQHDAVAPSRGFQSGAQGVAHHEMSEEGRQIDEGHETGNVYDKREQRQKNTGRDGHQHIVTGEAA